MHRTPVGPQRSPDASRSASGWTFPGVWSPFGGSPRHQGPGFSPGSPMCSPGSNRGNMDGSPGHYGSGGHRLGGQAWWGGGFRRPQPFSPSGAPNLQSRPLNVEKYFSPSMLQDPWKALHPVTAEAAATSKRTI